MVRELVLHVGLMKSGTSHLQALLAAQRDTLALRGVLFPGPTWADQAAGVREFLAPGGPGPRWARLRGQILAHPGAVLVSMEFLGPAPRPAIERLLAELGHPELRVVITARDLARSLSSMWQESLQNGHSWTWEEYLDAAEAARPGERGSQAGSAGAGTHFWRRQGLARVVRNWSAVAGTDGVTVVTVPPAGSPSGVLEERFAGACGVPIETGLDLDRRNESLGLASSLALRQLNENLDARGRAYPAGAYVRKRVVAKTVLAARRAAESPLRVDPMPWMHQESTRLRAAVERAGVGVVGDLDDLVPRPVPGVGVGEVDGADVAASALAALAELVVLYADTNPRQGLAAGVHAAEAGGGDPVPFAEPPPG
ncbi:hypothetical protein [Nocardioides sp. R-C-SC26]|uniref:hypothetical protein n=1 Tax=Nocardioides sp. R-C-SC26 TaxID=2870414 RepID=UPI001E5A961D|nr:hypothetical protein [Nocardioides sp. R-C-SC26]